MRIEIGDWRLRLEFWIGIGNCDWRWGLGQGIIIEAPGFGIGIWDFDRVGIRHWVWVHYWALRFDI